MENKIDSKEMMKNLNTEVSAEFRPTLFRAAARESLRGKWGAAAVVTLVYALISVCVTNGLGMIMPLLSTLGMLLIVSVMTIGLYLTFLFTARGRKPEVKMLFLPMGSYVRFLIAYLLYGIVICIGFILLVVPGVILSMGLFMTFFIMQDDPDISGIDAMKKSWAMMNGHKKELFLLSLSFFGWLLLGVITLIGLFFVMPYFVTAMSHFYLKLTGNAQQPQIEK